MFAAAVDPGETCGWVIAPIARDRIGPDPFRMTLPRSGSPEELLDSLAHTMALALIVIEGFWLEPDAARFLVGQEMFTSEVIGRVIQLADSRADPVPVFKQKNQVKGPIPGLLRRLGVEFRGRNDHERDAEAHMWAYWYQHNRHADWSN